MTGLRLTTAEKRAASRGAAGFTLIELLIALTLFGLLSVALVGGLRFGTRVWERGHAQSTAFSEVEAVHGFLRQQLEQVRLEAQALAERGQDRGFVGSPDGIEFLAPLPQHVGVGGLYRFNLGAVREGRSENLVLAWRLYRPNQGEPADQEEVSQRVLVDDMERLSVRYYGALEADRDPEWHDEWRSAGRLPRLIAIDLAFPDGDLRRWPAFVVAPVAAQNDPAA